MQAQTKIDQEGGFSMLELVVVMTVMLVVLGSVFGLMRDGLKVSKNTYEMTDAQENLRIAHEYLSRDLIDAGDGLSSINNIQIPAAFITKYLAQVAPAGSSLSMITSDTNLPGTAAVPLSNPSVNFLAGSDRVTILELDSSFAQIALPKNSFNASCDTLSSTALPIKTFNVGEIYCFTSSLGATFATVTGVADGNGTTTNTVLNFAAADPYGLNQPTTGLLNTMTTNGSLPTSLMRMRIINYYVNSKKQLVKRTFGVSGSGFIDSLVAEHVTGLSFRYFVGLNNPDGSVQQPVRQLSTATLQGAVRQVEVALTTETTHAVNFQNVNGTTVGSTQPITMTTMTSVRNLQFRLAHQPTSAG